MHLAPLRLNRKCGLGVSLDLKIGRLALCHATFASVLAEASLAANTGPPISRPS